MTFIDGEREYEQGVAEGRRIAGGAARVSSARLPIVTTYTLARSIAETMLQEAWASRERGKFTLPPSRIALDASDLVTLTANGRSFPMRLTGLSLGEAIEAESLSIEPQLYDAFAAPVRAPVSNDPASFGAQLGVFLDLPLIRGDEIPYAGAVAAYGSPWPGGVAFYRSPATSGYTLKALAATPAVIGVTECRLLLPGRHRAGTKAIRCASFSPLANCPQSMNCWYWAARIYARLKTPMANGRCSSSAMRRCGHADL